MAITTCPACKSITNTAIAHQWWGPPDEAYCAAKIVEGKYERGCGYDKAHPHLKDYVNRLIQEQPGT